MESSVVISSGTLGTPDFIEVLNCSQVNNTGECDDLPPLNQSLPFTIDGSYEYTMAMHSKYIYLFVESRETYRMDMESYPFEWETISMPEHSFRWWSSATVLDEVWFNGMDQDFIVFDVNTNDVTMYNLPFVFNHNSGIVNKGQTTYMIGVGQYNDEIWKNTNPSDKTDWEFVSLLVISLDQMSYLWIDDLIYLVGGTTWNTEYFINSTQVLNTVTGGVSQVANIPLWQRSSPEMAMVDDKMAMLGGWYQVGSGTETTYIHTPDIYTYDIARDEWTMIDTKMRTGRAVFYSFQFPAVAWQCS